MKSWKKWDEETFPWTSTMGVLPVPAARYAIFRRSVLILCWVMPGRSGTVLNVEFNLLCFGILYHLSLRVIPLAPISLDEFVGLLWAPGSSRIGIYGAGWRVFPGVNDAEKHASRHRISLSCWSL